MLVKAVRVKLRTNTVTDAALADTMQKFNAACNALSQTAWDTQTFRAFDLHKITYHSTRADFGLPSQLTVRAIAKVCDTYKTDRSQCHTFGPRGAVVFDARCFKMKGVSSAQLTTTQGRHSFSLAHGGKQREQLSQGTTGEADLLFVDGNYYLSIAVKFPDPPKADTSGGVLGVDMGIVELATDSEGESYSGAVVKAVRCRVREHRRQVQKSMSHRKRSRSAFKRLQKINRWVTGLLPTLPLRLFTRRRVSVSPSFSLTRVTRARLVLVAATVNAGTERAKPVSSVSVVACVPMRTLMPRAISLA